MKNPLPVVAHSALLRCAEGEWCTTLSALLALGPTQQLAKCSQPFRSLVGAGFRLYRRTSNMGASDSRSAQPGGAEEPNVASPPDHFVLIMTAPPGVGKEQLMGTFIAENVRSMAYVAKVGAVRANEPVRHSSLELEQSYPRR